MRLLIWHVDSFATEPAERGRSQVADAEPRPVSVREALVVFAAAEAADEATPEQVAERTATAIEDIAGRLGVREIVLHSFAHLFVERLSSPAAAKQILDATERLLRERGYGVEQTAFGWFNRLEMRAKGHPLSRVARQI